MTFWHAAHALEEKSTETGQTTAPDESNGGKTNAAGQEGVVGEGIQRQSIVLCKDNENDGGNHGERAAQKYHGADVASIVATGWYVECFLLRCIDVGDGDVDGGLFAEFDVVCGGHGSQFTVLRCDAVVKSQALYSIYGAGVMLWSNLKMVLGGPGSRWPHNQKHIV
jgi:hypothetical protein